MYKSSVLNMLLECVVESEERFIDDWDYISTVQAFKMIIDKFAFDNFLEEYHFSKDEYNKYFKSFTKQYSIQLHKKIKKEFKNKENGYES